MTNEELKKKICDIIAPYVSAYGDDERIADALIVAGIGDVSELKKHRVQIMKDGTIQQFYSGKEVEQIVKERAEYKHRAEVAERALGNACEDVKEVVSFLSILSERVDGLRVEGYLPEESEPKAYINRAEKELAEERKDD